MILGFWDRTDSPVTPLGPVGPVRKLSDLWTVQAFKLGLVLCCCVSPSSASNETGAIVATATPELSSASIGPFGPTAGATATVQRCWELPGFSQSWFLHLGLVRLNGTEHMQTSAIVLGTKLLARSRRARTHRKLLFPLHRFLSLFMSKFN